MAHTIILISIGSYGYDTDEDEGIKFSYTLPVPGMRVTQEKMDEMVDVCERACSRLLDVLQS